MDGRTDRQTEWKAQQSSDREVKQKNDMESIADVKRRERKASVCGNKDSDGGEGDPEDTSGCGRWWSHSLMRSKLWGHQLCCGRHDDRRLSGDESRTEGDSPLTWSVLTCLITRLLLVHGNLSGAQRLPLKILLQQIPYPNVLVIISSSATAQLQIVFKSCVTCHV